MSHLKRIAAPKTWIINRKENTFTLRPKPGPHSYEFSLPLGIIIRDTLRYADNSREVKKMLSSQAVLVDGKRRKDLRLPVGLFDVISFPENKEHFRLLLDKKGRLVIKKIVEAESRLKPCKIVGKTVLSRKLQLNLHDGRNILVDKSFSGKNGDTLLLTVPEQKIKETLELKPGAFVFLIKGKRAGDFGQLQEIKENNAVYQKEGQNIETLKRYLFVLGDKKPVIDLQLGRLDKADKQIKIDE